MRERRRVHIVVALLLTAVVAGGYWNSLGNGFVSDDEVQIVNNTMIKDLRRLPMLVTPAYFSQASEANYRPVVTFTYFMDYWHWGLNPVGFHLTNVVLHLVTTLLVYMLFACLLPSPHRGEGKGEGSEGEGPEGKGRWPREWRPSPALFGAALFAVHPVLTETVSWIAARTASLSAGLGLIALVCLLRWERGRPWRLALGLTAYGFALLSKESAVIVVLLLPLIDWARAGDTPVAWRERLPLYAAVAAITVAYLVLRLGIMHTTGQSPSAPIDERLMVWPYATWLHLRLLVFPLHLSAHYVFESPQRVTDPMVVFSAAVIAALLLGLVWLWVRNQRFACLGLLWILVALAPVANVIPYQPVGFQPVAERYLYLPAVGFALLLTLALMRVRHTALRLGLAGALLLTYGALTIDRTTVWRENFTLWRDTVDKMPESPWAHNDLGAGYEARGDLREALRQYVWAASILEGGQVQGLLRYVTPVQNIGRIYLKQGRLEPAARQFRRVLRLSPHHGPALVHLGLVYQRQGRPEHAIPLYQAALDDNPGESEIYVNLGAALAATGQRVAALEALERARALNPLEAVIHHNLGTLYAEEGHLEQAILAYRDALRLNPTLTGTRDNLAVLYRRLGRPVEAQAEEAATKRGGTR